MIYRISIAALLITTFASCSVVRGQELVRVRGDQVEMVWAVSGGALISFRFVDELTNPLNFEIPTGEQKTGYATSLRGHFMCLDRWGAPSKAEEMHGIPFHGEAPRVTWVIDQTPIDSTQGIVAKMSCVMPLAAMRVNRTVVLDQASSVALVTEQVSNTHHLARIYNLVQHPSIAPPFLNDGTLIDSSAEVGFAQDRPLPTMRAGANRWPTVSLAKGDVDLRRFRDAPGNESEHDVSSFTLSKKSDCGWVVASSPQHQLLLGYVWRTAEYPWLNLWRYRADGKLAARGLEFGTTGYHQPFPILVRQRSILDQPLYEPLDADETVAKSYLCFLAHIPQDFQGVASLELDANVIRLLERRAKDPREITVRTTLALPTP
ncbi:MAG: hypothetical protein FJ295_09485 [Planctomycetes bacterium]|nr:hypothetical protein [Planctomycetota bacterium]